MVKKTDKNLYQLKTKVNNFKEGVFKVVAQIPKGSTLSYQEVARRAGSPRAYRAVGNIMNKNYDPKVPCHRVIRSDGKVGGYRGGTKKKIQILKKEGVAIRG
ncbi:MAG: MGMT family protein [Candidatus Colwellbacteria bacterium]|nr:MGMT family protein [Candidatus Colwellbacteria bacterium]